MVLNLRLGQRGLFNGRPHHGFRALIKRPVHQEFHEFFGDDAFGVEIHRQIGVFPIAGDPQTFEFFALDIDPAFGKRPAFLTEIDDRHVVLVLALFAVLLFDLPFDRQPVTIPTGDIARVMAHHLVRAHNHVFQDFVQRMTDVQMPVGIGWAVMQHKGRAALLFTQAVIDADLFPLGQPVGLALGQSGPHREIGLGKVQRLFVVGSLGAHFGRSVCQIFGKGVRSARASIRLDPAARLSERRADNSNDDRKASHLGPPYRSSPPQGKAAKHVARSLPVLLVKIPEYARRFCPASAGLHFALIPEQPGQRAPQHARDTRSAASTEGHRAADLHRRDSDPCGQRAVDDPLAKAAR